MFNASLILLMILVSFDVSKAEYDCVRDKHLTQIQQEFYLGLTSELSEGKKNIESVVKLWVLSNKYNDNLWGNLNNCFKLEKSSEYAECIEYSFTMSLRITQLIKDLDFYEKCKLKDTKKTMGPKSLLIEANLENLLLQLNTFLRNVEAVSREFFQASESVTSYQRSLEKVNTSQDVILMLRQCRLKKIRLIDEALKLSKVTNIDSDEKRIQLSDLKEEIKKLDDCSEEGIRSPSVVDINSILSLECGESEASQQMILACQFPRLLKEVISYEKALGGKTEQAILNWELDFLQRLNENKPAHFSIDYINYLYTLEKLQISSFNLIYWLLNQDRVWRPQLLVDRVLDALSDHVTHDPISKSQLQCTYSMYFKKKGHLWLSDNACQKLKQAQVLFFEMLDPEVVDFWATEKAARALEDKLSLSLLNFVRGQGARDRLDTNINGLYFSNNLSEGNSQYVWSSSEDHLKLQYQLVFSTDFTLHDMQNIFEIYQLQNEFGPGCVGDVGRMEGIAQLIGDDENLDPVIQRINHQCVFSDSPSLWNALGVVNVHANTKLSGLAFDYPNVNLSSKTISYINKMRMGLWVQEYSQRAKDVSVDSILLTQGFDILLRMQRQKPLVGSTNHNITDQKLIEYLYKLKGEVSHELPL